MTGEEKNVHERAVKLRKMTDDKLIEHIDHIREEAYNTGYSEAEAQRASTPAILSRRLVLWFLKMQ